ncbi:shikimate dehydrogenase family protein [Nafulsella turpanensis]|uniref:shikimate dehydrogenase family protein n=1 Tax=Nafulsella turpanensis TaxID=1265690 RepID=UPI0004766478
MRLFGLIGYPLGHSFSKKYFSEKFNREDIADARYELFELPEIAGFKSLVDCLPELEGLNVTIPHKQAVIPYLDVLEESAKKVGAVNVIRLQNGRLTGYNSDYFGFKRSLEQWLPKSRRELQALVLGTGGASKAVSAALKDLNIPFQLVSRTAGPQLLSYQALKAQPELLKEHQLIINTTPLGTAPHTEEAPPLDYQLLTHQHFLYDLVYNPAKTRFMQLGEAQGAQVKNGLEMLQLQAEKAWEIWNS